MVHSSPGFLLARDMGDTSQGHRTVGGGPEIGTGGLWLCQLGLARRALVLACLARGLVLTKKPALDCMEARLDMSRCLGGCTDE